MGATAFYYTYEDVQVSGASISGSALLGNVPEARGYGVEFETNVFLTDEILLTGNLGLLDTEITDAGATLAANEGDELPRAPNVTANFGVSYGTGYGFFASTNVQYVGSTTSVLNQPTIDSYAVVDLAAGYDFAGALGGRSLRIEAFVENALDETYFTLRNPPLQAVGRGRTLGVAATLRF
jgi:outer membrane receptor protein involved in Fe transport